MGDLRIALPFIPHQLEQADGCQAGIITGFSKANPAAISRFHYSLFHSQLSEERGVVQHLEATDYFRIRKLRRTVTPW